jgi:hypothetical protein
MLQLYAPPGGWEDGLAASASDLIVNLFFSGGSQVAAEKNCFLPLHLRPDIKDVMLYQTVDDGRGRKVGWLDSRKEDYL